MLSKYKVSFASIMYLIGSVVVFLFMGLLYAWSIFRPPLDDIFPNWTATQVSITFTVSITFFCIGGFLAGKLERTLTPRKIMFIAALLAFTGLLLVSLFLNPNKPIISLFILYIFYGVFLGLAVGLTYNTLVGVIMKHFPRNAGMASGVLLFGLGIGALLMGKVVTFLNEYYDLNKIFFILGATLSFILILAALFIKKPDGYTIKIDIDEETNDKNVNGITLKEALHRPTFWMIFLWVTTLSIAGLLIINSAAPIAVRYGMAALTGLIVSVFNGVGRPVIGLLFDKLGRKKITMLNTLIVICGGVVLLLGAVFEESIFIYIGLPLIGLAYGGTPTILSATVYSFYGQKHFQVILATATFSLILSAILGPLISSKLQDISNGEYLSSFIMLIGVGLLTLIISALLTRFAKKENLE